MNPQHGLIGDSDPIDLPQTDVSKEYLDEEKRKAKFSRTAEFKKLKDHIEGRVTYFQHFLPDGRQVDLATAPTAEDWRVANRVIAEFKAIIFSYENAGEVVRESDKPGI